MLIIPVYLTIISYLSTVTCIQTKVKVSSHVDELRKMIAEYVYKQKEAINGGSIRRYLLGQNPPQDTKLRKLTNLHPSILKEFIEDSRKKEFQSQPKSGRRLAHDFLAITGHKFPEAKTKEISRKVIAKLAAAKNDTRRYFYHKDHEDIMKAYQADPAVIETVKQFMLQSIYQTRFNLKRTLVYRKKYMDDHSYKIAQLTAVLQETLHKMRMLHTTCMEFTKNKKIVFLPYLICYEKCLQAHTDIDYYVRRVFDLHDMLITFLNLPIQ